MSYLIIKISIIIKKNHWVSENKNMTFRFLMKVLNAKIRIMMTKNRFPFKTKVIKVNGEKYIDLKSYNRRKSMLIIIFTIFNIFTLNGLIDNLQKMDFSEKITVVNAQTPKEEEKGQEMQELKPQEATEETETEKNRDINKIVRTIHKLESSGGKNNYSKCEEQGLVNGSGYGIDGSGKYLCFKDRDEEIKTIAGWFERKLNDYSLQEAVCGYNLGFNSDHFQECLDESEDYPYLRNFNKLNS